MVKEFKNLNNRAMLLGKNLQIFQNQEIHQEELKDLKEVEYGKESKKPIC